MHARHLRSLPAMPFWISVLLLALVVTACSPGGIPQTGSESQDVSLEVTDSAVTSSGQVVPGITKIRFNNSGSSDRMVMIARLNPDVTVEQFSASFAEDNDTAVSLVKLAGGRGAKAGESGEFTADLKEGTYVVIGFPQSEAAPVVGSFSVAGTPNGNAAPESDATVDMKDFRFVFPESFTTGTQTWEVTNTGGQWHELFLVKPAPGITEEQILEMIRADQEPEGPPPFEEVASFGPVSEGERGWMDVALEPGTYMAICFLPDFASGESHAELGMISTFEVGE